MKKLTKIKLTAQGWGIALGLSIAWSVVVGIFLLIYMMTQGGTEGMGVLDIVLIPIVCGIFIGGGIFIVVHSPIWKALLVLSDVIPFGALIFLPVPMIFYYIFSWPAIQIGKTMGLLVDADELDGMPEPIREKKAKSKKEEGKSRLCPYAGVVLVDREVIALGYRIN